MTTQTHTPGPWIVSDHALDPQNTVLDGKRGNRIGRMHLAVVHGYSDNEASANARLIAAAPEMLLALRAIVAALSQPAQRTDVTDADRSRLAGLVNILRGDATFAVNAAQSAIAKAEGTP